MGRGRGRRVQYLHTRPEGDGHRASTRSNRQYVVRHILHSNIRTQQVNVWKHIPEQNRLSFEVR